MDFLSVPVTTGTLVAYLNREFSKIFLSHLYSKYGGSFGNSSNNQMTLDGMEIKMMVFKSSIKMNGITSPRSNANFIVYRVICSFVKIAHTLDISLWKDTTATSVSFVCREPMINKNPRLSESGYEKSAPRMDLITNFLFDMRFKMENSDSKIKITLINYEPSNGGTKIFIQTCVVDASFSQQLITVETSGDILSKLSIGDVPELPWSMEMFSNISSKEDSEFKRLLEELENHDFRFGKAKKALGEKVELFNIVKFSIATKGGLSVSGRNYDVMKRAYDTIIPPLIQNIEKLLLVDGERKMVYRFNIMVS